MLLSPDQRMCNTNKYAGMLHRQHFLYNFKMGARGVFTFSKHVFTFSKHKQLTVILTAAYFLVGSYEVSSSLKSNFFIPPGVVIEKLCGHVSL